MRFSAIMAGLFLLSACGGDDGNPGDAGMSRPEVTPHSGSEIGDPCARGSGGSCTTDQGSCATAGDVCISPFCSAAFVGGYCSKLCGSDNPSSPSCPTDAKCVALGQGSGPSVPFFYRCLRKCMTNDDCRPDGYLCLPVSEGGKVCLPGLGCEQPPAALETPGWQHPNLRVPSQDISAFEAEGNIASDNMGHVLMAQTVIYGGFGAFDGMGAVAYTEATSMFSPVQVYGDMMTSSIEVADPVVAIDRHPLGGGNPVFYFTWFEVNSTQSTEYVARSHDFGQTWDPPVAVSGVDGRAQDFDKGWIGANGGKVWVTWRANGNARYAYSQDGGTTWSPPATAARSISDFAQIAVSESGDAYLSWLTGDAQPGQGGNQVWAARWDATSNLFKDARTISGTLGAEFIPVGNGVSPDGTHFYVTWVNGDLNVRSNVVVSVSGDAKASFTFSTPVIVNDHQTCGVRIHPTVAVDNRNRGHVLWLDGYYFGGVAHYSYSMDDTGQTWSPPEVASDAPPWPFTTGRNPGLWLGDYVGIAVDATKVWVYYNGTQQNDRTHFYLTWKSLEP